MNSGPAVAASAATAAAAEPVTAAQPASAAQPVSASDSPTVSHENQTTCSSQPFQQGPTNQLLPNREKNSHSALLYSSPEP